MRILGIVALGVALSGCAIQRAQVAQDARVQMVGLSKEQILSCMGAPVNKAAEGNTEVWGYTSGNGMTVASASYDRYGGCGLSPPRLRLQQPALDLRRCSAADHYRPPRRPV